MTTLYQLACSLCYSKYEKETTYQPSHQPHSFCEPCLNEAMSRWNGIARLVYEAVARAERAETELRNVEDVLRRAAPAGCLSSTTENSVVMAMRVVSELRRGG